MKLNIIEPLNWDSNFFGYPVAKVILDKKANDNIFNIFHQLTSEKYRLTYLFVSPDDLKLNRQIKEKGAILVDQKTIFTKSCENHHYYSNEIVKLDSTEINEQLIKLALQAGSFSRFRLDKNFTQKEYERLYTEWLINSLNKEPAIKTFAAIKDSEIIGITTLEDKKSYSAIGLVAIDEEHRRKGIGYDLIHTADTISFDMGFKEIKVVTQFQNKDACRLYEKCNFNIENITNIYHFWQ